MSKPTIDHVSTEQEEWRDIPDWAGYYQVSNHGRVRSVARQVPGRPGVLLTVAGRVLWQRVKNTGYLTVGLTRDNKKRHYYVHALVLEAFSGPRPSDIHQACHNDGDKTNNRPENLRWGTPAENVADLLKHGNHAEARKTRCDQGHPFDAANTYQHKGRRQCRTCGAARARAYRQAAKPDLAAMLGVAS